MYTITIKRNGKVHHTTFHLEEFRLRVWLLDTAESKILETFSTVFNDFLVVNWYQNLLKTVEPVPITSQPAVHVSDSLSHTDTI